MAKPITYVGLDAHKDTIAVALAAASEPATHGKPRQRLPRRCRSGRFTLPAAVPRQDSVQRSADRAGGCRGTRDCPLRRIAGPCGMRRGSARHRPAPSARQGHRTAAGQGPVHTAEAARRGRTGVGFGADAPSWRILCTDRAPQSDGTLCLDGDRRGWRQADHLRQNAGRAERSALCVQRSRHGTG